MASGAVAFNALASAAKACESAASVGVSGASVVFLASAVTASEAATIEAFEWVALVAA